MPEEEKDMKFHEPRFSEEQMRDIEETRERLRAYKDSIQMYPALPEEEPSVKTIPQKIIVKHHYVSPYTLNKKDRYTIR